METFATIDGQTAAALSSPGDLERAMARLQEARLHGQAVEAERERVLDFCRRHPDALVRQCRDGHLTGSAFVVDPGHRRALLIHHRKLDRWLQPGGHADGEGDLALVALTEAIEETGIRDLEVVVPAIDVDIHLIAARKADPLHLHLDVRFLVLAPVGSEPNPDTVETKGAAWLSLDDRALLDNPDLGRLARAAIDTLDDLAPAAGRRS